MMDSRTPSGERGFALSAASADWNRIPVLPRYGMAPEWAGAVRPLVLVFAGIAFVVTWVFDANVDAQSGAYATGVLVLMTSASVAVTLSAHRRQHRGQMISFAVIAAVFVYTTIANIIERPDGVKIAALFIAGIIGVSLTSRVGRSFELRTSRIVLDDTAAGFFTGHEGREIQLIGHDPDLGEQHTLGLKERQQRAETYIPAGDPVIFLEVTLSYTSEFSSELHVHGSTRQGRRVLAMSSPAVANSIAALLLHLRDEYHVHPNVYFEWTEGNPVRNFLRFLFLGVGEIAPTTREVLRRAEPDTIRRPRVYVG